MLPTAGAFERVVLCLEINMLQMKRPVRSEQRLRLQLLLVSAGGGAGTFRVAFFDPFFVRSYKAFF